VNQLKKGRLDADDPKRATKLRGLALIIDRLDLVLNLMPTGVRSDVKREYFMLWKNAPEESGWET